MDQNGAIYYYNSQTDQSSWDFPQQEAEGYQYQRREGYEQPSQAGYSPPDQYGGHTQQAAADYAQHGGGHAPQDDHEYAGALNDVAWAEECLKQRWV